MKTFKGFAKGINLGGWISQCGNKYNDAHYQSFIQRSDIEKIASWGLDHVRLPIDYNVIQTDNGEFIESGFSYINDCLAWCKENNLNTVLDLHKTCGYVFDDKNYCNFFENETLQAQFIKLWEEMARRYGNKSNIAFELLNEVTSLDMAKPWNEIIKKTVPAIRAIAPSTKIIVGGIYNSSIYGLSLMDAPIDDNMVFTFHCYSPFIFTHQNAGWIENMPKGLHTSFPKTGLETMTSSQAVFGHDFDDEFKGLEAAVLDKEYFKKLFKPALEISEKYDVPLYCGEYGVIDQADTASTLNWYKSMSAALTECNIPRSAWTYKDMDFGVTSEHYTPIYESIIKLL